MHLYGREPVELDVELALAADFRPMLTLRGIAALPPPAVRIEAVERRRALLGARAATA